MSRDEMGSYTRKLMAERAGINIVTLGSPGISRNDNTGPHSCPTCNRLLTQDARDDNILWCSISYNYGVDNPKGCGKSYNKQDLDEDEEEEEPIEQQYGRSGQNTKPIIASQPRKEKQQPGRPSDIPSNASYEEQDFNP